MTFVIQTDTGRESYTKTVLESLITLRPVYSRIWIPEKNVYKSYRAEGSEKGAGQKIWLVERRILFPSYLFIDAENHTDLRDGLREFSLATSVNLLGKKWADTKTVTPEELDWICRISDERISDVEFTENRRVRFVSGPMVGMDAFVKKVDRHKRQLLLVMNFFGL